MLSIEFYFDSFLFKKKKQQKSLLKLSYENKSQEEKHLKSVNMTSFWQWHIDFKPHWPNPTLENLTEVLCSINDSYSN